MLGLIACVQASHVSAAEEVQQPVTLELITVTEGVDKTQYRQPITSSATRTDTPVRELPQSVQVISRQLIEDLGASRMDDLLSYVSGVAQQNNFGGLWDNYSIRGFSGNENGGMNILLNGFAGNRGYSAPRDTANVERVDFLKGPAASLYGSSEPGGTINIVTKKPQFKAANSADLTVGSNDFYRSAVDSTGALTDNVAYRLNAALETKGSFRDDVRSKRELIAPALTWVLSDHTILNYEAEILRQTAPLDRGIVAVGGRLDALPTSRFLGEPSDGDITLQNQTHQLTLEHQINNQWHLRTGISHKEGTLDGFSTEPSSLRADNATLWRQRRYRDFSWHDTSLQAEIGGKFSTGSIRHQVLAGVEADWFTIDQRMLRVNPSAGAPYAIDVFNPVYGQIRPTPIANTHTAERQINTGMFLQDQISIADRWKLLAGLRFDSFRATLDNRLNGTTARQRQNATSPRLGLTYLASRAVSLYVSTGESFRANTGSDSTGNSFKPETARAVEAGVKYESSDQRFGATMAVFDITKQNVLTVDPGNIAYRIAAGEVRSRGVELDASGKLDRHWRMTGSFAYTDAMVTKDNTLPVGTRLINVPEISASILAIYEDVLANGDVYGVGSGLTYVGVRTGDALGSFELPGHVTAKLLGYWQITPKMRLSLDINNLFNKRYYASSYSSVWITPGDERSVALGLNVKF